MRSVLVGVVALTALLLNPFYACSDLFGPDFGATEMRAAVEGTWRVTLPDRTVTIRVVQGGKAEQQSAASLIRPAVACGHRTFVKSAEACMDVSELPLEVTELGNAARSVGRFMVFGTSFRIGELVLDLGTTHVRAMVAPDGKTSEATVHDKPVTIERISR